MTEVLLTHFFPKWSVSQEQWLSTSLSLVLLCTDHTQWMEQKHCLVSKGEPLHLKHHVVMVHNHLSRHMSFSQWLIFTGSKTSAITKYMCMEQHRDTWNPWNESCFTEMFMHMWWKHVLIVTAEQQSSLFDAYKAKNGKSICDSNNFSRVTTVLIWPRYCCLD